MGDIQTVRVIIFLDQYTKWLVMETMLRTDGANPAFGDWFFTPQPLGMFIDQRETYNNIEITGFLNFVMVWNEGISFGLFDNNDDNMAGGNGLSIVFIGLALIISILMIIWLALARGRLLAWALALIVGGAIGNVIDRIRFGAVADFVDVHVAGWHWPAFNLADTSIAIGALLLVIDTMTSKDKNPFLS
jgi:signal peptidase II